MTMDDSGMTIPLGRFTRTGIRRSGDDYQDLCALELLVEMLEHPIRYSWVKVEADEAGVLDDILALREDESYIARQVKYAGHPEEDSNAWTWDKLLLERSYSNGKNRPSLLSRWFHSWQKLKAQGTVAEASLESNRKAGEGLREIIDTNGLIPFDSILQVTKNEILRQFGDEGAAREFFSVFKFRVDRPELDVLNDSISRRFFALGGTREGWLSLKDQLRLWVRERYEPPPDGTITVTIVRGAANWHHLTSLPENFEVPNDYVLPSHSFHENFFRDVVQRVRSCQVLTAPPALGKSTYLSYLVGQLQEEKIPVIRHHYFLMVGDRSYGRLDHSRIVESLMNNILTLYPEALGTLGARNPNPEELGVWLTAVGAHFVTQEKLLVVVIDGLDHVWRERDSREELVQLFEHLLPAPVGVVVVVGTQPVDDDQLPPSLLRECPRTQWVQLESLNRDAVAAWLEKHEKELDLPSNDNAKQNVLSQLASAFHAKTDGHPLHLRFVLGYLLDRGQGVSIPAITGVPGTPSKDIMDYYSALWKSIPERGRDILHLLACIKFPLTRSGAVEALDPTGTDIAGVNSAFRQIQHLLTPTPLGFRPFHSSLFIFVRSQESHLTYAGPMRAKARQWLANKAPDYWRWAYSWLLDADDGQTDSLIDGPSRVWLSDSLSRGYPQDQIAEILGRSALAALEKGQLGRFVELALLKDYLKWQDPPALLGIQLSLGCDDRLRDISLVNSESLVLSDLLALAFFEARQGNLAAVEKCFTTLNHRVPRESGTDTILEWARSLVTIAAITPNLELDRLVKFIQRFRTQGRSSYVLDALAFSLRREKNMSELRELLHVSVFSPDEQVVIRKHAVGLAFESGIDIGISDIQRWTDPFSSLYRYFRSKQDAGALTYWPAWSMLERPENNFLSRRPSIASFFKMAYYAFVSSNLLEKTSLIDDWISKAPTPYVRDLLNRTNRLAAETASAARNKITIQFSNSYRYFEDAQRPRHWTSDREASEIADGMQAALTEITFDLIYLQGEWVTQGTVTIDDMQTVLSSPFSDRWDWLASYVQFNSPFLPESVLTWLIDKFEASVDDTVDIFPTRAERYSKLALVSVMHNRGAEEAERLLLKVVSNNISYGSHKDMLIYSMLEIAESCHNNGMEGAERWLLSLAPAIAHINEFTDGDETGYLPKKLGESLARISPNRLPDYYLWLSRQEEYFDARSVFQELIRIMDFADPFALAIARTGLDQGSLSVLRERAEAGNLLAADILKEMVSLFGIVRERTETSNPQDIEVASRVKKEKQSHPGGYPPPQIKEFLRASNARTPYEMSEIIKVWLEFWRDEQGLGAYDAVKALADSGYDVRNGDLMASLAKRFYGVVETYRWVVLANRDEMGWSQFFTKKEFAQARWEEIKRSYPDRWLQFIQDTITRTQVDQWHDVSAQNNVLRLVEYCIALGHDDKAREIAEKTLATIHTLTSVVQFDSPDWFSSVEATNGGVCE
jgi:hypothetical protein